MGLRPRKLVPASPLPGRPPPRIGHNQGPALDAVVSWRHVAWRKSHRRLWRPPPAEVARRRGARAAELGLSYRQYTAVLLDRGARVEALVFTAAALRGDDGRPRGNVAEKLDRLARCRVLFLGPHAEALLARLADSGRGVLAEAGDDPSPWLRRHRLPPATAVMIGDGEAERPRAARADLGLYLWRQAYFGAGP